MTTTLRRAAGWLRDRWARAGFAAAVLLAAWLLADDWLTVKDILINIIRAAACLLMFEGMLRYSTRKIAEGVAAGGVSAPRFADVFMRMMGDPIGIAIFVAAGMIARALIVATVWR